MNKKTLSLLMASLLFAACAKKAIVKKGEISPDELPTQEQEQMAEDVEASIRGKDFTEIPQLATIYFELDSSEIRADMRKVLAKNADFLKTNPRLDIRVDGHCDERGTSEYNLALGQRRASAIRSYYKSLGIAGTRIGTISWGEEKPICEDSTEECWDQNRRVETQVKAKPEEKKSAQESKKTPEKGSKTNKKAAGGP